MALTKAKLMELIDNGDIDVGGGGFNPNILHNWDFRNPVNQRGATGTISVAGYFYDRWLLEVGTVYINSWGITLPSGGVITQAIEGISLRSYIVTVTVRLTGSAYMSVEALFPTTGMVSVPLPGFGTVSLGVTAAGTHTYIKFLADADRNVVALKLEVGASSTLHLDPPMDHAVELLKCQRFFFAGTYLTVIGFTNSTTTAVVTFDPPVCMRILPSVNKSTLRLRIGSTLYNSCPFVITEMKGNTYVRAAVTIPSGTWQNASPATGEIPDTMFVSADL